MNKKFIRPQGTKCDFSNRTGKVDGIHFLVFYSVYVGTACRGIKKYVRPLLFSQGGNISTAPPYSNNLISYFDKSVAWPRACKLKTRCQYACLLTTLKSPVSTCAWHRRTNLRRVEDLRIEDNFLLRHRLFWYSFSPQSALQQVHSLFQSQFSTQSDLVLPFARFSCLSFTLGHPVSSSSSSRHLCSSLYLSSNHVF
jgi:hypothetical protein